MIINVNQLRAFFAAARHKSVTIAAEELMVTPPAVSMQIKQLEEKLCMRLLFRDGNSIRLTEVGSAVYQKSKGIFKQIKDMENYFEDISRARSGVLRIGCPSPTAKHVMPRLVNEFKKAYPEIRIILDVGNSAYLAKSILTRRNELAIIRQRPEDKRLKLRVFATEEVVLLCARNGKTLPVDKISVNQVANTPLIMQREGSGTRGVVLEFFARFGVTPFIVMESASVDLIKELISLDRGAGFLVRSAVQDELAAGILRSVSILEGVPQIHYGIGYLDRRDLSPAAWAFLRLLDQTSSFVPPRKQAEGSRTGPRR